jgi:hypothetical protein
MLGSSIIGETVPEGNADPRNARTCYTPGGQRVVVERHGDVWTVTCDDRDPVRHRLLDVALIEAIRDDVQAHWGRIEPGHWTRLISDTIVSSWPEDE